MVNNGQPTNAARRATERRQGEKDIDESEHQRPRIRHTASPLPVKRGLRAVIGVSGQDGDGAIDLLQRHNTHQLVRPCHRAEGDDTSGLTTQFGIESIRSADDKDIACLAGISCGRYVARKYPRWRWICPVRPGGPAGHLSPEARQWPALLRPSGLRGDVPDFLDFPDVYGR